ncbi:MAG: carbon-nitrogen hydrolase family protein [Alphaproteobacteria bacterium]|nr:carbon-nitrogen hydrolase family protein [Alphaproteobacteria bacterium]
MRVALVQLRTPADPDAALAHVAPLVREAAATGARLVVTPEASNLLQRDRAAMRTRLRSEAEDVVVQGLTRLARELGVWLLIGSVLLRREDGQGVNRALLVAPDGRIVARYDKIHMFDVDLPDGQTLRESAAFVPGERAVTAMVDQVRLGLSICYDLRFPALYGALAKAGAHMLAIPAAFTRVTGLAHWETLLRARAIETGAFVLAPAQGGRHEDGRETFGHSLIVGPWGEVMARLDHDAPGVLAAELDLSAVERARRAIPALANARDFEGP